MTVAIDGADNILHDGQDISFINCSGDDGRYDGGGEEKFGR